MLCTHIKLAEVGWNSNTPCWSSCEGTSSLALVGLYIDSVCLETNTVIHKENYKTTLTL
jgi:hypothetical protein